MIITNKDRVVYFNDRAALGEQMAVKLAPVKGTDAIVIGLKKSSLMACITLAVRLRAWVYPLFFEIIQNPTDPTQILGAVVPSGEFCLNPAVGNDFYEYVQQEFFSMLEDEKREAMKRLNAAITEYGDTLDPHVLNNRTVVLVGDVMMNSLELEIIKVLLKPLSPARVIGTVGNVTIDVSTQFHIATHESHMLDIIPGSTMNADHYFEAQDAYSDSEKQALIRNIATYWT